MSDRWLSNQHDERKIEKSLFLGRFQDFRIVVTAVLLLAVYVFEKYTAKFALAALGR
jgi:hypothetical protein